MTDRRQDYTDTSQDNSNTSSDYTHRRSDKSSVPYLIALLILGTVVSVYWLYDSYFRANSLPVIMASPPFALSDLNGETVTESRYDGKVRLTSFIFTRCPDICPVTTANKVLLQTELKREGIFGSQVEFVTISFDPVNDTPEVLQQYAERMGIDQNGWTLLRGEEEVVQELASQYRLSIVRIDDGLFAHSITSLLLIDGNQRVRKIYSMGEEMDNAQIAKDIQKLLLE